MTNYDAHIIQEIIEGRDTTLRQLYRQYRQGFVRWGKNHFSLDQSILEDAFQDALEVFYRNVLSGKLTRLDAPLPNYLAGIGRFKLLQYLDKNKRIEYPETMNERQSQAIDTFLDVIIQQEIDIEQTVQLKKAFDTLSAVCQQILTYKFYENKRIEDIMHLMKYENLNTTSATLARCLKNLKNLLT